MKEGGKILNDILYKIVDCVKPGISTLELDDKARKMIKKNNAIPAFLGYNGYPNTICISINNEVVHGIPSEKQLIQSGDIVSLDLGIKYKDFYTDKAVTIGVGKISSDAQKLINVTSEVLEMAITECQNWQGKKISDIAKVIQGYVEKNKFSVVRDLSGHGIGKKLHEPPQIPNFYNKKFPIVELHEGMALAIEPMVNIGDWRVKFMDDGWTVKTVDGGLSAHFEDTIFLTHNGCEILTR